MRECSPFNLRRRVDRHAARLLATGGHRQVCKHGETGFIVNRAAGARKHRARPWT